MNRNIDPVVAWCVSDVKEINITVTYFHESGDRSVFWLFVLDLKMLPVTSPPPKPGFLLGKEGGGAPVQNDLAFSPGEKYTTKLFCNGSILWK